MPDSKTGVPDPRERFRLLQRRAQESLENPLGLEPSLRGRPTLRLWHSPSFYACSSWLFLEGFKSPSGLADEPPMLRQVIWDAPFDGSRFHEPMKGLRYGMDPVPTIDCRDFPLDTGAAGLLESLGQLTVPIDVADRGVSIDGESFGFHFFGGTSLVQAEWKNEEPRFAELSAWFKLARAKIQTFVASGTASA